MHCTDDLSKFSLLPTPSHLEQSDLEDQAQVVLPAKLIFLLEFFSHSNHRKKNATIDSNDFLNDMNSSSPSPLRQLVSERVWRASPGFRHDTQSCAPCLEVKRKNTPSL